MRRLVDRGTADIKPEDINDIIEEAVRVGRMTSEYFGPEVELLLDRSLPPVLADRIQIQQVIINLMHNAYEAVLEGQATPLKITSAMAPRGRISLQANTSNREVVVTVADSGPGIPDDQIDTIFDPLISSKSGGLGVGLAVCRSIVDAHGGRIWAESSEDGAVFRFVLPIAEDA
jgi:two-component system sensor kinase FixL